MAVGDVDSWLADLEKFNAIDEGKFIVMVQEFHVIYDSSHPEFKNTTIKNTATSVIAKRTFGSLEMATKRLKTIRRPISTMLKEFDPVAPEPRTSTFPMALKNSDGCFPL